MAFDFFGFSFGRTGKQTQPGPRETISDKKNKSFVLPSNDEGAKVVEEGGVYGQYLDMDGSYNTDREFIIKYRSMALHAEVEMVVSDIVNESIVKNGHDPIVTIDFTDNNKISKSIQSKIVDEFNGVLKLLNFDDKGYEIFRKWYIDSRLFFHIIPNENLIKGIKEIRPIDPVLIQKIQNITKSKDPRTGVETIDKIEEFFVYNNSRSLPNFGPNATSAISDTNLIKVSPDSIVFVPSGLYDASANRVIGYLQKAIKPLNQLRMVEDATVIYRISRAPERRVFYIDVGDLPKVKAEQYIRSMMNKYRTKLLYNSTTGEIQDDSKHMSMMEDFWLPRREGGRGTEITTLGGGTNLGEMTDVEYFKKKFYQSLNLPSSRIESDNGFSLGRSTEITRDEVKFSKFIDRIRSKFSLLFFSLLKTQLILKGVIRETDWDDIRMSLNIIYNRDSYFTELKDNEILKERLGLLQEVNDYVGKYYSEDWVRKHILKQTPEMIAQIDGDIKKSAKPEENNDGNPS